MDNTDDLWNDVSIQPPPINTYKNKDKHFDVQSFHVQISDVIFVLDNQGVLHKDAAVMSRLIYIMGRKFRHDIGYSFVRKTNTALLKYLNLKFLDDLKSIQSVIPECITGGDFYLPTRQMLQYILLRMQTFSKIMCRIVLCARKAATFFYERLKRGDAAWMSLMPYSVLSRIWVLSKRLLEKSCEWYDKLLPFASQLKIVGMPFLPEGCVFPQKLRKWLDFDWLNEMAAKLWKSNTINSIAESENVIQSNENVEGKIDEAVDFVEKSIKSKEDELYENNLEIKLLKTNTSLFGLHDSKTNITDLGEVISRDKISDNKITKSKLTSNEKKNDRRNVSISFESKIKKEKKKAVHCIASLQHKKDIFEFIVREEDYRINEDARALSKDVGLMQWETLKRKLVAASRKCNTNDNKISPKLLKIINKIWDETCGV